MLCNHTLPPSAVLTQVISLPKLELPQFNGDTLVWQTFWDCFEAAVHNNTSLTGVQKLSYLRAQLRGDAARVIAGFQLTNDNYGHSVTLLMDRFGQVYKQVEAYMQAFVDLPSPSNSLSSLRQFYDTTEGHIHSLATLGEPEDSYGSLLVMILLGKLPAKTKQNIIRAHGNKKIITKLQVAVLNEIHILEMGSSAELHTSPIPPTASFLTSVKKSITAGKSKPRCPFCAVCHFPFMCESVKDPRQQCEIVHQNKLCFSCLGHHKVSQCNSRHRCHTCQQKHHTSLCINGQHSVTTLLRHLCTPLTPNSQPTQ